MSHTAQHRLRTDREEPLLWKCLQKRMGATFKNCSPREERLSLKPMAQCARCFASIFLHGSIATRARLSSSIANNTSERGVVVTKSIGGAQKALGISSPSHSYLPSLYFIRSPTRQWDGFFVMGNASSPSFINIFIAPSNHPWSVLIRCVHVSHNLESRVLHTRSHVEILIGQATGLPSPSWAELSWSPVALWDPQGLPTPKRLSHFCMQVMAAGKTALKKISPTNCL